MDAISGYQAAKLADMNSRRINTGDAVGIAFGAAALLGVGLVALYGNARAKGAENLIASQQSSNQNFINYIANQQGIVGARINHIQDDIYHAACPQKVEMWSCTPCPCPTCPTGK